MNAFRRNRAGPVLSRDESVRQGRAVRVAQAALIDVEAVRTFLNCHHPLLGARPIDLAVASEDGLAAVESAIAAESRRASRPGALPGEAAA